MDLALRNQVRDRAGNRCEYCRIHQDDFPFLTFPLDHIEALQHNGETVSENLALSCPPCNSHKGPNIAGRDQITRQLVPLFHPRTDTWVDHFEWNRAYLIGKTPIGRTTVDVLAINNPDSLLLREALIDEGVFPPGDDD